MVVVVPVCFCVCMGIRVCVWGSEVCAYGINGTEKERDSQREKGDRRETKRESHVCGVCLCVCVSMCVCVCFFVLFSFFFVVV